LTEEKLRIKGHEFHFSCLLILITLVAWELPEGATFLDLDPFEPLAVKFSTLWYSNDMRKKWKSNGVFHIYYNQLKEAIRSEPHITPNTLQWFRPMIKFSVDSSSPTISVEGKSSYRQVDLLKDIDS
jgi:hypothetical protein